MSDTLEKTQPAVIQDAAELENVFETLEEILTKQVQLLAEDKLGDFITTSSDVTLLLNQVTTAKAPLTWKCFDRIRKIHGLHHALGLTLATKSEAMAEGLKKMRSGKSVLKAYRSC